MKLISRKSRLSGALTVPGSKSHTIRAVAVAAMAQGVSKIHNPLISEDTVSATEAAKSLGARLERGDDNLWIVEGVGGRPALPKGILDMGNSGTSLRIFSALAALGKGEASFDGDESLRTRLMSPLLGALEMMGAKCESTAGKCPLTVEGPLRGGMAEIEGKSSQFVTAVLFAAPLCPEDTELKVFKLNERPYVEITLDWLERQGIEFERNADMSLFKIKGGQSYKAFEMTVPADFSTACFPLVGAAISGGEVEIRNLDFSDRQGDKEIFKHLEAMGAEVLRGSGSTVVRCSRRLKGMELDINATPDALPILAVAGACAEGVTVLKNAPQARLKETDRIACMSSELGKMGIQVEEFVDGMAIRGGRLSGAKVKSYKDHRIAMALALAGIVADASTEVEDAGCAAVTYPDFVQDFKRLGADFTEI